MHMQDQGSVGTNEEEWGTLKERHEMIWIVAGPYRRAHFNVRMLDHCLRSCSLTSLTVNQR